MESAYHRAYHSPEAGLRTRQGQLCQCTTLDDQGSTHPPEFPAHTGGGHDGPRASRCVSTLRPYDWLRLNPSAVPCVSSTRLRPIRPGASALPPQVAQFLGLSSVLDQRPPTRVRIPRSLGRGVDRTFAGTRPAPYGPDRFGGSPLLRGLRIPWRYAGQSSRVADGEGFDCHLRPHRRCQDALCTPTPGNPSLGRANSP